MRAIRVKSQVERFNTVLSAVKKLSDEEKQLLRLQLFGKDSLSEMKAFEVQLKKKKRLVKKKDNEIVKVTTSIRNRNYAETKKMLH
jgi:hypothetical protein